MLMFIKERLLVQALHNVMGAAFVAHYPFHPSLLSLRLV